MESCLFKINKINYSAQMIHSGRFPLISVRIHLLLSSICIKWKDRLHHKKEYINSPFLK